MKLSKHIGFKFFLYLIFISQTLITRGQGGLYINEIQASNISTITDKDFVLFSDWIELINTNNIAIDLAGFFLSDDINNPQKWQFPTGSIIPPNGYLLIFCDDKNIHLVDYHTNFKLSQSGEQIGIFDQYSSPVDIITFDEQLDDVSFGRKPDGQNGWFYFAEPTPNNPNLSEEYFTSDQAPDVSFSSSSGFYNSPMNLTLTTSGSDFDIRYTLDGSIPSQNSLLYYGPISIDSTRVIRSRSFGSGLLPGKVASHSFLINEEKSLPVTSMIIHPDFLWDPEIGIYVDENIEQRATWERSCQLEYFNENQVQDFDCNANIRLFGNTAYYYPQKSLGVFPDPPLDYQLFESRETTHFHSYLLRSSSDDWPFTMIRDALMHSIVKDHLNIDYQAYSPSVLFINGAYWGIHNIREKINERFIETYHNVDPDELNLIYMGLRDSTISALAGDLNEMNQLLDFIQNNDLSTIENFTIVKNSILLDNYIDYQIANIFFSNISWHHNIKIWKSINPESKWQWLFYDLDRGMTPYYLDAYNILKDIDTSDLFFSHFNQNYEFKNQFLNRFCGHMNSTFRTERLIHYIDSLKDRIASEIPEHSLRWKNECDPWGYCGIQSVEAWNENINVLKDYAFEAQEKVYQYVMDFYGIPEKASLSINVINPEKGKIFINGIEYLPGSNEWIYFKGVPLFLTAIPNSGQLFLEWQNISFNDTLVLTLSENQVLTARFGDYCVLPEHISTNLDLTDVCDAYITSGNIIVDSNATLTIENGIHLIVSDLDSIFVYGNFFSNGTAESHVIIRSLTDDINWGSINARDGIVKLNFTDFSNCKSAVTIENGELHLDHCTIYYSPYFYGDIVTIHGSSTILTNNRFYGPNDAGTTDVIDCEETSHGLFSNNEIFGTTDDGIDIGMGSENIKIIGNLIKDCKSMGISIGESTHAQIEKNVIVNCYAGIQVHTNSLAIIDHNTLYGNDVSVKCYHYDNEPLSGGHAIITNTILSKSDSAVFRLFENSTISIDYSLSDTDSIPGNGNLNADPMFKQPEVHDFTLLESSPCINAGDPLFPADPDGTRTDIGALFYDQNALIYDFFIHKKLLIYPNPSLGSFWVHLLDPGEKISSIEIFDSSGKRVWKISGLTNQSILIKNLILGNGLFYISLNADNGNNYSGKVMIIGSP